uniref:CCHC-type domain-containing protein n=1 Tax=Fagus sylvatica TaxID=28930 RepID=A0A2N9HXU9_FAGSY
MTAPVAGITKSTKNLIRFLFQIRVMGLRVLLEMWSQPILQPLLLEHGLVLAIRILLLVLFQEHMSMLSLEIIWLGNNMDDDEIISSDEENDEEPPEEGEVVIKFTRELKHRIRAPWSTSLIVKVFGRSVGYVFLVNKLKTMWNFAGNFSCVDLGLGFFLIRFDSQSGFEEVLKRGPWFIGEHFLSLRPWVPNFRASEASVKTVAIWVRLPELPVEYYHKDSLLHIGSGLGPVLRVDFNTAAGTRGRFARICVQIDLDKPLARTVRVGKTRLAVIYEGIGLLCFHCGRIGHRSELCPSRILEKEDNPTDIADSRAEEEEKLKNFGPWMLVSRRKRQNKIAVTAVPRDDASTQAVPDRDRADRAVDLSAVQGHVNINQHGLGVTEQTAGQSDVQKRDKDPLYSGFNANRRVAGSAEGQKRVVMTSTQWGVFPLFKASPSWRIRLGGQSIRIDEDVIELIRKDPLHVWGWYDAEIARAWTEIAPAVQEEDPPLLTDMVWIVRCQPLWELRYVQFLEEVFCATMPEFEERKVMLSTPIHFNWVGNRSSLKLAQIAKCVPLSNLWIRCSELRGKGFLEYQFTSTVIRNNIWEMWPERAWNSLEEEGTLFPPNNPPFMSSSEIGVNILTWNCRGVLNPCFRKALLDTLNINNPDILILTETRLGGDRAAELAQAVEVGHLCSTEQEIHASVKVRGSNSLWLISAIYGSPRRSERRILWENLKIIAGLHNLPWVMLGDFNDILLCEEKWGGPKYTWSNCHDMNSLIMERLDRVLANSDWRILFPEASVTHLPRTHSDHCPVFLNLCPNLPCTLPRPFRFESIWFSHVDFLSVVEKAWATPALNLSITFSIFAALMSAWNKSKFGNIFHRKKRILARLNGVQCALTSRPSESLYRIEKSLREDYFVILKLGEELWALKSRVGWVVEGDRNTKFFHTSTIIRRRANKIVRLRNSVGEWITDNDLIRLHIQQGFVDLFSTSHLHPPSGFCLSMLLKLLDPTDYIRVFSRKCWPTVGDSVVKEVRQIFSSGRMPEYLNRTLISLIPKCLGPETLSQFRPISLCNTVYKIVTKIIVSRLRPTYRQSCFPFSGCICSWKKGRMGHLILKLDLEKAYDRLEWDFIREVLTFFKFPPSFVDLVLECVSTSSFSILVNGGQLENFKPSRGIRQGDPLSPYLFILCMEYLSLKILEACDNNTWKAIKASRTGPSFSHLLPKSKVFFSPNVNPNLRQHLCSILGVSSTPNLGKYLGFPLRSNGRSTRDFDFVVEKVQAKLSSWKAKLLSPAGRVILVQSVTSAIPAYYMQNVALPIRVCSNLDKLNRDFLWGSIDDRKKMHMVSWDKVCRSRDLGGLGLYSTKARNLALLAKLNWRVMENPNSLWAKTLIAKYCPNGIMDERLETRRSGSSNWKGLKKGHEVFRKGLRWVVNNGQEISFWHDLWVGDRPLRSLVHGPLSLWEDSLRVCDVVEGVSMWNLSILSLDLPTCIRESIKAISVCPNRPLADKRVWDSVGGEFKLGKAYSIACNNFSECSSLNPSSWIWKVRTSPRISYSKVKNMISTPIKWVVPPLGWFKLNTDGSSLGNPGLAGGGGIIRNHEGDWVGGFSRAIGITTSVQAELRALKDGLNLAIDLRILNLEIEMDSLVAVELVNSITTPNTFLSTIVTDCRSLLERFEELFAQAHLQGSEWLC